MSAHTTLAFNNVLKNTDHRWQLTSKQRSMLPSLYIAVFVTLLVHRKPSFLQALQHLPRSWRLLLITFGSAVSVYRLANAGSLVAADVVSGQWQEPAAEAASSSLDLNLSEAQHMAALQSCQEVAQQSIRSWR